MHPKHPGRAITEYEHAVEERFRFTSTVNVEYEFIVTNGHDGIDQNGNDRE